MESQTVTVSFKKRSRVQILYNCGRGDDPKAIERLRRLARSILKRCSPEDIVAEEPSDNLQALARGGGRYIVCMPVHRGSEVDLEVVSRPGRYQPVTDTLQVKEVTVGDGERRRRYVVCYNPKEVERQRLTVLNSSHKHPKSVQQARLEPHS